MGKTINIRPTTSVYATYKNIKYDPWTAIAEFVDNSTQSYYDHISQLKNTKYWKGLDIEIEYGHTDDGNGYQLIIKDNAFGMNFYDFKRAIILDSPPKNPTRSEFGMGLKTAACWFGTKWSVESTALGSDIKYKAIIDVDMLHKYKNEEIEVIETTCSPKEHGTTVTITNLNRTLSGRQIGKTKDQLRGMYRVDLRTGDIKIYYNGEGLFYTDPPILTAELPDGTKKEWKEKIEFIINKNNREYHVNGFMALLEEGSTSGAGFTLLRRGRVIVGGYENCYRPEEVFKKSNSFTYQRLIGELNMDDWPVTQTKDAFDWYGGLEDELIDKLVEITAEYRDKAEKYRKGKKVPIEPVIDVLVDSYADAGIIDNVEVTPITEDIVEVLSDSQDSIRKEHFDSADIQIIGDDGKQISFTHNNQQYIFNFILKKNNPDSKWLNITKASNENTYIIEWNIRHPFFKPYIDDPQFLVIMQQFTFALALSEIEARRISVDGKIDAGTIRMKMNEILKSVMRGDL